MVGLEAMVTYPDIVKKDQSLQVQFLVPDIVYVITGLFCAIPGFWERIKIAAGWFRIRAVMITMIYNKGLTLSCQSKQGHTTGEIINFILLILYKNVGLASVAAFFATIIVMLANVPLGKWEEKFQGKLMESKDKRMKATSEILRNMRILKLQGWEMKFLSKIVDLRKNETGWEDLSSLATFRILQQPIYSLPDLISMIAQTKVSLDRITSFLRLVDLQSDVIERLPKGSSDTAIEIVDGNFSWDLSSPNPTLKDINLRVCRGMRVAVCGTVGSGKSSLLSCILGEVPKISGILKLCGTKAYVAQSPWIQSGKIEENILFGKEMDRESAVDAHTGTHLFKECLLGLLGSKTVIYVTHQVEFLPAADLILVMKDGRITQAGKYNEILNSGTDFMELVGAHKKALSALNSVEAGSLSEKSSIHEDSDNIGGTSEVIEKEENKGGQNGKAEEIDGPKGQLVQEEEREKGKVGLWVYWKYIRTAYGGALVPFILLSQILFQLLQIGSNYWMAWSSPVSDDVKPAVRGSTLMIVYVALAVGSSFSVLSRAMLLVTATILFNKMHLSLFRAPMSFFDATPSGRILNRASTDQNAIDTNIPMQVGAFAFSLIRLRGIIAVMSQVAWQVFIVFIPVIATCIWYQIRLSIISVPENASRITLTIHGMLMFLSDPAEPGLNHKHCILRSGKSTLIQILFRIVEPAAGQIMIDGTNISSIGLHDLRSRLSIIPQDPTMFEGTALDKCQLGDEVRKKEGKLDSTVIENGENWSMGQRQLVCLGRVLLKKSKVLVPDEATASVDTATENLIQQTLRQHFVDSTVITIAHRTTSVLDSDMVLLLDHGLIEEYDTPTRLLENKSSSFAKLVAEYTVRLNSSLENAGDI
ncbi:ABC transporter C family member 3 [Vitis vinifera]|uniref:ABC-type xenobiotic transporter n=1 Tax=Vitis vinifera TaxID=29760 RepID=A0A438EQS1_VITVI|nr:ABC transporter C family member 3 [Vitis vinifera]